MSSIGTPPAQVGAMCLDPVDVTTAPPDRAANAQDPAVFPDQVGGDRT
jgi:hypothetical protein